jgi:Xaa-Pro dipeptidase
MTAMIEEIQGRWTRARSLMDRDGLDGLLITDKYNYWYFTGHQSREFDKKMRPMLFLLPRNGDPIAMVYRQAEAAVRRSAGDIRFSSYEDVPFPIENLVEAFPTAGLDRARVGMEFGEMERMGLSIEHLERLTKALPDAKLVDGGALIGEMRMIKTAFEVAQIRKACTVSLEAWERAVASFRPGGTGRDFSRLLAGEFAASGMDYNIAGHITVEPSDLPLAEGDVLWCDFGGVWGGYQADVARRMSIGQPSDEQKAHHGQISEILKLEIDAIGPGRKASDIAVVVSRALEERGHPRLGQKKRVGHGLGLAPAEPPSLSLADDTVLMPGMILTPEPRFNIAAGRVHIEEVVHVTQEGCELLTEGANRLFVRGEGAV